MRITIGGVRRDISIGPLATLSLAKAREKAHEIRKAVAGGRDPASERRTHRSRLTDPSEVIATNERRFRISRRAGIDLFLRRSP